MINIKDLPTTIAVFPLSNFIIFPNTTVPLNIFEPRYVNMINDSMEGSKFIGIIQPKKIREISSTDLYDVGCQGHTPPKKNKVNLEPDLYQVGCLGKITNFQDSDGRYLIDLRGLSRFNITREIVNNKPYRECLVNFDGFHDDLKIPVNELKFSDLELIFKNLKSLFEKKGYMIDWKSLEKQDLNETINALAMASPFSLEEKQILLESKNLEIRKDKIAKILITYNHDNYYNTTVQ